MNTSRFRWAFLCAALFPPEDQAAAGQPAAAAPAPAATTTTAATTKRGDAMIDAYLVRQAKALDGRFLEGAATAESWRGLRPKLERELYSMLGLWPIPEKTPLHATVTGTLERDRWS